MPQQFGPVRLQFAQQGNELVNITTVLPDPGVPPVELLTHVWTTGMDPVAILTLRFDWLSGTYLCRATCWFY